jgi:hypothetical protein
MPDGRDEARERPSVQPTSRRCTGPAGDGSPDRVLFDSRQVMEPALRARVRRSGFGRGARAAHNRRDRVGPEAGFGGLEAAIVAPPGFGRSDEPPIATRYCSASAMRLGFGSARPPCESPAPGAGIPDCVTGWPWLDGSRLRPASARPSFARTAAQRTGRNGMTRPVSTISQSAFRIRRRPGPGWGVRRTGRGRATALIPSHPPARAPGSGGSPARRSWSGT